ncbi:MAG: DUF5683 domain-containing protein [Bacteroidia bacterium]
MNIIDATVDAHLFDFNVDDDISLKVRPAAVYSFASLPAAGIVFELEADESGINRIRRDGQADWKLFVERGHVVSAIITKESSDEMLRN